MILLNYISNNRKGIIIMNDFNKTMIKVIIIICMVFIAYISFQSGYILGYHNASNKQDSKQAISNIKYGDYAVNGVLEYDKIPVLIVNEYNIEYVTNSLKYGGIDYNGSWYMFRNLNQLDKCKGVKLGSVLHFMEYDNIVLFKNVNCIPSNQKLKEIRE